MFSVVKVREGLAANDYKDPGWYKHPPGTVAYEVKSDDAPAATRATAPARPGGVEMKVRKPTSHQGHH
jgi:hypothetical protein